MRRSIGLGLALLLAPIVGCSDGSDKYPGEERSAERSIERAEEAGADKHSKLALGNAKRSLNEAREEEKTAAKDQEEAQKELDGLRYKTENAKRKVADRDARLRAEQKIHEELVAEQTKLERRRDELVRAGASEPEIRTSVGSELAISTKRVASEDAYVAVLGQSLRIAQLEKSSVDKEEEMAKNKLAMAHDRYELARAQYERSEELSKLAEAESYEVRRQRMEQGQP
jgi:hypothetical protein